MGVKFGNEDSGSGPRCVCGAELSALAYCLNCHSPRDYSENLPTPKQRKNLRNFGS